MRHKPKLVQIIKGKAKDDERIHVKHNFKEEASSQRKLTDPSVAKAFNDAKKKQYVAFSPTVFYNTSKNR